MSAPYDYTQAYAPPQGYAPPPQGQWGAPGAPPGGYGAPPPMPGYGAPAYGAPPGGYGIAPGGYGAPPAPTHDEVRTIFITGFPADVKERELNNLLRFLPGYEASQMNWKNGQAQGFALFVNGQLSRAACDSITQLCFDESTVLRCEMARKNMYIKGVDDGSIKRARMSNDPVAGGYPGAPAAAHMPAPYGAPGRQAAPGGMPGGMMRPAGGEGDNPPCNTLFVGNLGDGVSEGELQSLFAATSGFRHLKLVRGARTTAFVEYGDIDSAIQMHSANQNAIVASSDRGPLRVQFSKNPFGKKRDLTGLLIDTLPKDYPAV
ncbi:hypothetical protein FOA52_003412 [Chlamydomonas sp. UWO 241]|nr:hypothetical protein FOA52_003412 [Chlamydomonas sp. UWO 241]